MEQYYESVKKEADESSEEEDHIQYRNPYLDSLDFEAALVKSEGDDTIDQSCITSSESTVEQFDQLDVNTDDFVDSSELLISEVQKRPLLYDVGLEDYNDRNKKAKCWEEVYKQMINNWAELSSAEKNNRGRIIQKRWRSIRDSFMKAYKKMNKNQSKKASAKRKRYVYFDQMMFIIPSIEKRKNNELTYENITPKVKPQTNFIEEESTNDLAIYENKITEPNLPDKSSIEDDILEAVSQMHRKPEIDEDRMFLLSLLPSFKKMNHDVKLAVRIEVLQIIRQALQKSSYSSVSQTVSNNQNFPTTPVQPTTQIPNQNFRNPTQSCQNYTAQNTQIQQWPSCQQNNIIPTWPTNFKNESVESQILDLMQ